MDGYPQRDTIFEFDYFISLVRSVRCFLFSLLSMENFARFNSQLVWMCCCSFLVFFCVFLLCFLDFFFDRWYFYVFTYILVSDIPWGVRYCSQYIRLYLVYLRGSSLNIHKRSVTIESLLRKSSSLHVPLRTI